MHLKLNYDCICNLRWASLSLL